MTKEIIREAKLTLVNIADMRPAPVWQAQRQLRQNWVDHLVRNFDLEEMGNPTLSFRDGVYWIIDGQHRIEALKVLGFGKDVVECFVYEGLTREQEAERFLKLNDQLAVDVLTKFRIGVKAGREPEVTINRVVQGVGGAVTLDKSVQNHIAAVGALHRVFDAGGPDILRRALIVVREAFGPHGFENITISGVGMMLARFGDEVDDEWLVKKLSDLGGTRRLREQVNLTRDRYGRTMWESSAAVIADTYNKGRGRSGKLTSWWK